MAHFYTWLEAMYDALCEATARISENPGRLRRCAPYKGLLAPCAASRLSPRLCGKLNIVPDDRFAHMGKAVVFISKIQT